MARDNDHDARVVEQFTRWAAPFAGLPVHSESDGMERTLAAAALTAHARVLDVACGPGIVACAAAAQAAHVIGIDLTPAMIDEARKRQERLGVANVTWQIGDAGRLPFQPEEFDVVLTRYSFHHMTKPANALAEMKRVCRPNGRIVVVDPTPSPDNQAAYDRMERIRDPSHTSALTLEQLRAIGHEAGLKEVAVDAYRLEALLASLADEADMPALTRMFEDDIADGADRLGVGAWRAPDGIRFFFPVSIVAWER